MKSLTLTMILGAACLMAACTSSDMADMEKEWPNLADIGPAPDKVATAKDHEAVIDALRAEAEARKGEGYQAPEAPAVPPKIDAED